MSLSRCLVLVVCLCVVGGFAARSLPATPSAGDERNAKLAQRYEAMLAANPVEGIALDRLWKSYEEQGATAALIDRYHDEATRSGGAAGWLVYGHLLKKADRFDEAAVAYAEAAKADPHGFLPPLARGDLALLVHRPADAAALIEEGLEKLPAADSRRPDLWLKLGSAWLAAGQPERAAASWEKIVALNPSNVALHRQLAETYARHHFPDKAMAHYEFIVQHAEPAARAGALRELGRLHEGRGEFDAARDAFEQGLALTSRDNWLHGELQDALIRLYQREGRAPELDARWRQAAERTPRDLGGYLRLEALAEAQADPQAREGWLEKITALAPHDRDSRLKLARLLVDTGQRERAAAAYDALLHEQPDDFDLTLARADLDVQLGAPAEAVRRVEARLAKNPADETLAAPALEFFLAHRLDEPAERCLRTAVRRQPGAPDPAIALAKFYFSRRRTEEARQVLAAVAGQPGGDVPSRLERWQRLAATYKDENLPDDALRCWQEAAKLSPGSAVPLVAAGELLLARGENAAAAVQLEKAVAVSPDEPPREELEHKLFQALAAGPDRAAVPPEASRQRHPGYPLSLGVSPVLSRGLGGEATPPAEPLAHRLTLLAETAARQPTPDNFLRLARWQSWAHASEEAAASAEKAVSLDPGNIPARLLLVSTALDAHRRDVAELRLREIMEIDPSRRAACLRQLAEMQSEDGNFDASINTYAELQQAAPGALEPWTDLAHAQQRADRWFDALATWKHAAELPALPPAQRADVRQGLVAAYEHVGEFRPAAELLQTTVDDQPELTRKQELFRELAEFCAKHDLLGWLGETYERRLAAQPDDYFTMVAAAGLRKAAGREQEAYQLLSRAFYSAPDPVAALKGLADEAESLGEDDQALADRRRLVGMAGQNTTENLEKLALLQEANLDEEEAGHTWNQLAARYPRDTSALVHAAEFFERTGQPGRARELVASAVSIEPHDIARVYHLGTLELDAGHLDAARALFEQVLAQSSPEKPGDPLRLPAELDVALDPAGTVPGAGTIYYRPRPAPVPPPKPPVGSGDESAVRLRAIGQLASLLPGPTDDDAAGSRKAWLGRWTAAVAAGARSEPLEAFFAAGANDRTMDLLAGWLEEQPASEERRAAFLVAGLHLGDYRRLAAWTWSGDVPQRAERGPQLVDALQQFLATGGKPGAGIVGELFPVQVRARDLLWKAAKDGFAERRWYAQAAELGEKVFAQASNGRAAYVMDLAKWELYVGKADLARAQLGQAIDEGGGVSLDGMGGSPIFEALRGYYLLLPEPERSGFVDSYLQRWRKRNEPVHALLSAVLLHGLQGQTTAAQRDLDSLLALRMVGQDGGGDPLDARRWSYLLANGAQLQTWSLEPLAVYLWRKALQEDSAFERQNAETQSIRAEMRNRLAALEAVTAANPEAARERTTEYLRSRPPLGLVNSLAMQMIAASRFAVAQQIYGWLTELEPDNGENWRGLLNACEAAGDADAAETILASLLASDRHLASAINRLDLVYRLAAIRENEGDGPGARRLLEKLLQGGTVAPSAVAQLAQSYDRAGRHDDAARVWQAGIDADPDNATHYRLALAATQERRGNLVAAIPIMEAVNGLNAPGNNAETRAHLARLYLQAGRAEDARKLALGCLQANDLESLAAVAQAFGEAGQRAVARDWLRAAVRRSRDPQARFQLQRHLLQQSLRPDDLPLADFVREMRRLGKFADASPALKSAFEYERYDLARQRGADDWLEALLRQEWRDGRGDFLAGERLVQFYLDRRQEEPLRRVVDGIDHRPNLPEPSLYSMEKRLDDSGRFALALPVADRLFRRFPQNEVYALGKASLLWKTGRPEEANGLLEALDLTFIFRDELSSQIAAFYDRLGDASRARAAWERAVRRDPSALRSLAAWLMLAQRETARKNWPEARRLLRTVCRQASEGSLQALADFLQASGQCDGDLSGRLPWDDFPLTFPRRAQLAALVYGRLKTLNRPDAAFRMVLTHPGLLAGSAPLAAALRQDAGPAQFSAVAAAIETAAAMDDAPSPRLNRELAALYVHWSENDSNGGARQAADQLAHLQRANQLAPDDFEIARRLAALCWEAGRAAPAVEALRPFLAPDAVSSEREQARQLLAKH